MAGVKQRRSPQLESLTKRISSRKESDIDQLYGLEPVFEPGTGKTGELEQFVPVQCPYCGERLETRVDLTADEPSYIEDCQVCCRPIQFVLERAEPAGQGALVSGEVRRID